MAENNRMSKEDRKEIQKQRKSAAKQAEKYHKSKDKQSKNTTSKNSNSKIKKVVNENKEKNKVNRNLTREQEYVNKGKKKIRNLTAKDYEDGYYIDEFGEKQRQDKRVQQIRTQEKEKIYRPKKPVTPKQVKRRRKLLYGGVLLLVLIIGVVLSLTVLFKTENIIVEGDKYYTDEQIVGFGSVKMQQNIFINAMNSTPEEIVKNLPYVEKASVNFSVPDTITIKITDAVPSYVIKNGSDYIVVSAKGRILDTLKSNDKKLPELKCDKLKSTKNGEYVSFSDSNIPDIMEEISQAIIDNKVNNITGIDVSNKANLKITYDDRIIISLGLPEDISYKIKTAFTIINEKLDPNKTKEVRGTLDVSSCNTSKISHYKPETATTQPTTTQPSTDANGGDYQGDYSNNDAVGSVEDTTAYSYYNNSDNYDTGGQEPTDSGYENGNNYNSGYAE